MGRSPRGGDGGITAARIEAVVFDLGGVLLRLRDPLDNFCLEIAEAEFLERWLLSPSVRAFECGAIDSEAFARAIVDEFSLAMDWPEFRQRFDAWPECLFPDALPLLDAVPVGVLRGLLTNTNAMHWGRSDISGRLAGRFDRTFLSFETGVVKPDRESFAQVVRAFGCPPDAVLYFDDNPINVEAAAGAGMQAHLARCPADAARVLARLAARA